MGLFGQASFAVFFLMSESLSTPTVASTLDKAFGLMILLLDYGQVMNNCLDNSFLWSNDVLNVANWLDCSYWVGFKNFTGWTLRVVSFVFIAIVGLAFFDLSLVLSEFRTRKFKHVGVAKQLRFLYGGNDASAVAALFAALFSAIFEFNIAPTMCSFWIGLGSIDSTNCVPFSWPTIPLAIVSVILAMFHVVFSTLSMMMFVEINPLSPAPLAVCTGRGEAAFVFLKSVVICLTVWNANQPVVNGIIMSILMFSLTCYFLYELPFHHPKVNHFRAALHGSFTWALLCSTATAFLENDDVTKIILIPGCLASAAAAATGSIIRHRIMHEKGKRLVKNTEIFVDALNNWRRAGRLQERLDQQMFQTELNEEGFDSVTGALIQELRIWMSESLSKRQRDDELIVLQKSEKKGTRTFYFGNDAVLAAKTLLADRRLLPRFDNLLNLIPFFRPPLVQEDRGIIAQILMKALIDENSDLCAMWMSAFVHFVLQDPDDALQLLHLVSKRSLFDVQYFNFAIQQNIQQREKSALLGGRLVSTIGLMELTKEQDEVKIYYMRALLNGKNFWRFVGHSWRDVETFENLYSFMESAERANRSFKVLDANFPQSATLVRHYASFVASILRDAVVYRRLMARIEEKNEDDYEMERQTQHTDDKSQTSGASTALVLNQMQIPSWVENVLAPQMRGLKKLMGEINATVALLILVTILTFVTVDVILFSNSAQTTVRLVFDISTIHVEIARSLFYVRNVALAAMSGTLADFSAAQTILRGKANTVIQNVQTLNVESPLPLEYYRVDQYNLQIPTRTGEWRFEAESLVDVISEYSNRLIGLSYSNMSLWTGEESQMRHTMDLQFVLQNGNDGVLNALEAAMLELSAETTGFVSNARSGIIFLTVLNCALAVIGAYLAIRSLSGSVRVLRLPAIAAAIAMRLSHSTRNKLTRFYRESEMQLQKNTEFQGDITEMEKANADEQQLGEDGLPKDAFKSNADGLSPLEAMLKTEARAKIREEKKEEKMMANLASTPMGVQSMADPNVKSFGVASVISSADSSSYQSSSSAGTVSSFSITMILQHLHLTYRKKLFFLALLMAASLAVSTAISLHDLDTVTIGGSVYKTIMNNRQLLADLRPSEGYILEPFLSCLLAMQPLYYQDERYSIDQFKSSVDIFQKTYSLKILKWRQLLAQGDLRDSIVLKAFYPALTFFNSAKKQFFPKLEQGDIQGAADVVRQTMQNAFQEHADNILFAMNVATDKVTVEEQNGIDGQSYMYRISQIVCIVCGIGILFVASTMVISLPASITVRLRLPRRRRIKALRSKIGKVVFLIILFSACLLCLGVSIYWTASLASVQSDQFDTVMMYTLMTEDCSPPPAFLMEMFYHTMMIPFSNDLNATMTSIHTTSQVWRDRFVYWSANLVDTHLRSHMDGATMSTGEEMLRIYFNEIEPLLLAGNISDAMTIVYSTFTDAYYLHRKEVHATISEADREESLMEHRSAIYLNDAWITMACTIAACLLLIIALSWLWFRGGEKSAVDGAWVVAGSGPKGKRRILKFADLAAQRSPFYLKPIVFWGVGAGLIVLFVVGATLPLRFIPHIEMASEWANLAAVVLARYSSSVFLARELTMCSEWSMMQHKEMTLKFIEQVEEFQHTFDRLRGATTITGVSASSSKIDDIMSQKYCFRPTSDGSGCLADSLPYSVVSQSGLEYMLIYAGDLLDKKATQFLNWNMTSDCGVGGLTSDPNMVYLLGNFDGDVMAGVEKLRDLISVSFDDILSQLHFEQRLLFASYFIYIIIIFFGLMRTALQSFMHELNTARKFAAMIPFSTLTHLELSAVKSLLVADEE